MDNTDAVNDELEQLRSAAATIVEYCDTVFKNIHEGRPHNLGSYMQDLLDEADQVSASVTELEAIVEEENE